ncbi:MAG: ATP-dependent DNA helicase RecG [Deltaproteobacteria bacterium]|nr:MAG: ATP-dependent DNA helicase RecG [Deltaproteobacteria bacterium]
MTAPLPIQFVKGVGPRLAGKFAARGIRTVQDALYFFPKGYEDRRRIVPIRELSGGMTAPVKAKILSVHGGGRRFGGPRFLEVVLSDGTGRLAAKWFRFHPSLAERFHEGETVTLCGPVRLFRFFPEMHHPEILGKEEEADPVHSGRVVPVYPDVVGIPPRLLRKIQWEVVRNHAHREAEFFPPWILSKAGVPQLSESLAAIHFPPDGADAAMFREFSTPAQRRLVFGELFSLQWALARRRAGTAREPAVPLPWDREIVGEIKRRLPFDLTGAQRRVVNEILSDLRRSHPMQRLLQGDVGSGKTIVAWIAAMVAWRHGAQSAIMAPTEILAEQHYHRFTALTEGLPVKVALLSAALSPRERDAARRTIRDGLADIAVGTHALIQESVEFRRLSLAIIDEQHRFGVLQRAALRKKASVAPHLLVMTATPIPRTLAIALYGDLDVSVIDEMPKGRIPVRTRIVGEDGRGRVFDRVREEIARGGRAYIVLPLVEESEKIALRDATRTAERVREAFPDAGVGLLHGRMKAEAKESVMRGFMSGALRILVSTTVVEVGVDVPEATVMIVEHAERFGLSQLHQLRGRVGRGSRASHCFLMVGGNEGEDATARLAVMENSTDGFRIAEEDLRIRGPGDFAGVRQSGIPDLVFADLVRDAGMLRTAKELAEEVHAMDPGLSAPGHEGIRRFLDRKSSAGSGGEG